MADTSPATEPRALVLARRAADGKPLSPEEGAALLADLEQLHAATARVRAECHTIGTNTCNATARILTALDGPARV